jgi:hypothetical protein
VCVYACALQLLNLTSFTHTHIHVNLDSSDLQQKVLSKTRAKMTVVPSFIVSARKLHKDHNHEKKSWVRVPTKGISVGRKLNTIKITTARTKIFVSAGRLKEQRS